jgi:hypothetical protein
VHYFREHNFYTESILPFVAVLGTQSIAQKNTCSKVCCAKSVVDIMTPAMKEPNSRLRPSLSLHWNGKENLRIMRTRWQKHHQEAMHW